MKNNIQQFLNKLENNNNRDWFQNHKEEYIQAKKEADELFEYWLQSMGEFDSIENLKKYRIYRDIRFSKNKTPYKTHFSASLSRTKPKLRGGYYLELRSDSVFMAVGFWAPNKEDLFRFRKEIEYDPQELGEVLNNKALKDFWGNIQGDALKTAPKGFEKDINGIEYIRLKQWVFTKELEASPNRELIDKCVQGYRAIRPFFDYMSEVFSTDLNGEPIFD
jgi:uncharacterized protein (TIGR02453 family)